MIAMPFTLVGQPPTQLDTVTVRDNQKDIGTVVGQHATEKLELVSS